LRRTRPAPSRSWIAAEWTTIRIEQKKSIRIAYREDAPPFSYKDKIGEPAGFMVDLCGAVAKHLADLRNLPSLRGLARA
jgi:polar amino acid transport system substrate-binding protein/glutamate/aspartate transport system substrate-binding protein